MRITYLSSSTIPSETANSVHVMKMCQALGRAGNTVELVARDAGDKLKNEDPYKYYSVAPTFTLARHRMRGSRLANLAYWWKAGNHGRKFKADLVYGRDIISTCIAALRGSQTVLELHELKTISSKAHYRVAFETIIRLRSFRYAIAISSALKKDLVEMYPQLRGRVRVAHDAADTVTERSDAERSGSADGVFRVGYVGNIYAGRGLELLVELARRCPEIQFRLVGKIDDRHGKALEKTADLANLHTYGHLPFEAADAIRQSCDVLVAPYEVDVGTPGGVNTARWMSPLKLFEYMACGKAIICSDLPVLHEILTPDVTAILSPPGDVDAWERALRRLYSDAALRLSLGKEAKAVHRERFTWDARVLKVLDPDARQ